MPAVQRPWDSALILETSRERACAIIREIERLSAKDFAYPLPHALLKKLLARARFKKKQLDAFDEDDDIFWNAATSPQYRLSVIRTTAAELKVIHEALQFLYSVDSTRIPFEIIRSLENLEAQLLHHKVHLMLMPFYQYNYFILPLSLIDPEFADSYLLGFPSADSSSLPMHTMFFHELGHPVFQHWVGDNIHPELSSGFSAALGEAETHLSSDIHDYVTRKLDGEGHHEPEADSANYGEWIQQYDNERMNMLTRAAQITLNWLEEIFCDLTATKLTGPAYLCASESLSLTFFHMVPSDTHPDNWLRLKLIERAISHYSSSVSAYRSICERFGSYAGLATGIPPTNIANLPIQYRLAHRVLRPDDDNPFIEVIFSLMDQNDNIPNPFELENLIESIDKALSGLKYLIPPDPRLHSKANIVLQSHHIAAYVFIVTWLFKLKHLQEWKKRYKKWDSKRCNEALNDLAIKALESSEIEYHYLRQKSR